ncbi:MAG: hypothetical protein LBF95_04300, partial [Treponema sp.]|nr:hypothetical protein [Treponema sp.]
MRRHGNFGTMLTVLAVLFLAGCDLLNNKPEIYVETAMDAKIAWANAPYVSVLVDEGGLGTASPRGTLDTTVKLGYSFVLNYVPKSEYPFRGWQAKSEGADVFRSVWTSAGEEGDADKVKFVPLNAAGTEVEVFVYVKPEGRITIGPLGADNPELSLRVDEGGTGTASPRGSVSGIRLDFPFTVSFLPNSNHDFNGWQLRLEGSANLLGSWATGSGDKKGEHISFVPLNAAGTEIEITIHGDPGTGTIIVEPLNGNNPFLSVELSGGGLGTISPTGTLTTVKQGFAFSVSYLAGSGYAFNGWQARLEGEAGLLASWTAAGASGEDKVVFAPQNITGTEVKITALINPLTEEGDRRKIIIGPLGADSAELDVEVATGGLGTASPQGPDSGIREGFPFLISYQPDSAYPFTGWQAKVAGNSAPLATWTADEASGADKVSFAPQNITGTEVRVTVLQDPGGKLTIAPLGADSAELDVEVATGGLGTAIPQGSVSGIRLGFPFTISYQPNSAYPFTGWQAKVAGSSAPLATWTAADKKASGADKVVFAPQNATGTEVRVTVLQDPGGKLTIGPLGADQPNVNVTVDEDDMGTASPRGTLTGIKQGIPFTLNYVAKAEYPFTGWQAMYDGGGEIASWTPEETKNS